MHLGVHSMPKKNLKDTNQLCKINVPVSNKSTMEGCKKNSSEELDKCFVWSNNLFVLTNILIFRTNKILVKQIKFFYLDLLRILIHLDRFLIPVNNSPWIYANYRHQSTVYTFKDDTTVSVYLKRKTLLDRLTSRY